MGKTKISALVLDFGGVISLPQRSENVGNILKILKIEHDKFIQVYLDHRPAYDRGHLTGELYWKTILDHFGLASEKEKIPYLIREDVTAWTGTNESMLEYISETRSEFQKLAIISNMTFDALAYLRVNFDWLAWFDDIIFSCEIGINKPDKEIYQICLKELDIPANECLFVDDSEVNIQAARESGMHAIQFRTTQEFLDEFALNYYPDSIF